MSKRTKRQVKCQVTRRKELFYYVTSGSNVTRDVHCCVTVFYQQIENNNIANQIHGFTKFVTIECNELLRFFDDIFKPVHINNLQTENAQNSSSTSKHKRLTILRTRQFLTQVMQVHF